MKDDQERSEILGRLGTEHTDPVNDLLPALYDELKRLAASYLRRERVGHTLQPTALVHEAYLRLASERTTPWRSREHFIAWAARLMRQILVNHAVARRRLKRGGKARRVPLTEVDVPHEDRALDLLALDEALTKLAAFDEKKSRIVEVRFFGGLGIEETAALLGLGHATVEREWKVARAWLHRELERGADGEG